jgi:Tfp pilus assembly protein PilV
MRCDRQRRSRRGLALIIALVILALLGVLGGIMVRGTLSQRVETSAGQRAAQASWLAESAAARARARLLADPSYRGETWEVPAEDLGGRLAGSVVIEVTPDDPDPARRRVRIQADYPAVEGPSRARKSRQFVIRVAPRGESGEKP